MLRFGPYRSPRVRMGEVVQCEYLGETHIVGISGAPIQWPLGVVQGHRLPVLMGDLVRAVEQEAALDIAEAWGVGSGTVTKWRKALRVRFTKGTPLRLGDGVRGSDPTRAAKIAAARRGKPRPRRIIEAMRKATKGKPLSAAHRAKLSEANRKRGARPPWLNATWSRAEEELLRTLPPAEVTKRTGRTLSAVYSWRRRLGINRRWTAEEDEIVRRLLPSQAEQLIDRSRSAIKTRRTNLKSK